jgi:hypothetical protein
MHCMWNGTMARFETLRSRNERNPRKSRTYALEGRAE